jgi:hypothetical protein
MFHTSPCDHISGGVFLKFIILVQNLHLCSHSIQKCLSYSFSFWQILHVVLYLQGKMLCSRLFDGIFCWRVRHQRVRIACGISIFQNVLQACPLMAGLPSHSTGYRLFVGFLGHPSTSWKYPVKKRKSRNVCWSIFSLPQTPVIYREVSFKKYVENGFIILNY